MLKAGNSRMEESIEVLLFKVWKKSFAGDKTGLREEFNCFSKHNERLFSKLDDTICLLSPFGFRRRNQPSEFQTRGDES